MLKFSINKSLFLQALLATKRAIDSKNAIPVLSSLKLNVSASAITLTGSNGQISIENTIPTSDENAGLLITSPGAILLEASFFINVVSSLPDVIIDLEEIEHHQIVLKSGKSEITLKGKDVEQYPHLQEVNTSNPLILETKLLKTLIAETAFAASQQESRPILTGVHMVLSNQEFKAVATDSHRMSQRKLHLEDSTTEFDVVLPSRSLREFSTVFSDNIKTVEIYLSDSQVLFKSDHISFYTRMLEGTYPDTDRLLTTQFETEVIFKTESLRHAMERAFLISNATQNGTVRLEVKAEKVSAHVNSPEVGRVNEELESVSQSGSDLTISFNPTYLIDALKALKSESVTIRFISPVRPFTLTPTEDVENFVQLITPVRTS
ncbi:DNA polymerase III subunit beta [Streptococcus sciuri]|uniref:Beta sliding clamp n=1 Tax=Streptococcus sciuri TaxID=2973939 RepID=A0ABT2F667_9STRE|nr:DNA polymerase III subunit beta [Streptococcus sciuri]MCS4487975.1 DNA polymerase III subunit beta [Streptococcus sciuri]